MVKEHDCVDIIISEWKLNMYTHTHTQHRHGCNTQNQFFYFIQCEYVKSAWCIRCVSVGPWLNLFDCSFSHLRMQSGRERERAAAFIFIINLHFTLFIFVAFIYFYFHSSPNLSYIHMAIWSVFPLTSIFFSIAVDLSNIQSLSLSLSLGTPDIVIVIVICKMFEWRVKLAMSVWHFVINRNHRLEMECSMMIRARVNEKEQMKSE